LKEFFMKYTTLLSRLSLTCFLTAATISAASAQETPPYANATVDYRGTGCDQGSARASLTSDFRYISVLFDRFSASIGVGSDNPNAPVATKNCVVIINLDVPAGWSFQFEAIEYRGFVSLPAGTRATQRISAFTRDTRRGRDFQSHEMTGPLTDNFSVLYRNPITEALGVNLPLRGFERDLPGFGGRGNDGRGGDGRRRRIRRGDLLDCVDRPQRSVLVLRSAVTVQQVGGGLGRGGRRGPGGTPLNEQALISVDSADAAVQKLKLSWNKCILD
jgi:hypothetical protein